MDHILCKASSALVALVVIASATPASAQSARIFQYQENTIEDGAEQAAVAVRAARDICLAAGGIFDASRVRTNVRSKVKSNIKSQKNSIYTEGRTLHIDGMGLLFGRRPQQESNNEVTVEVSTTGACRKRP